MVLIAGCADVRRQRGGRRCEPTCAAAPNSADILRCTATAALGTPTRAAPQPPAAAIDAEAARLADGCRQQRHDGRASLDLRADAGAGAARLLDARRTAKPSPTGRWRSRQPAMPARCVVGEQPALQAYAVRAAWTMADRLAIVTLEPAPAMAVRLAAAVSSGLTAARRWPSRCARPAPAVARLRCRDPRCTASPVKPSQVCAACTASGHACRGAPRLTASNRCRRRRGA